LTLSWRKNRITLLGADLIGETWERTL